MTSSTSSSAPSNDTATKSTGGKPLRIGLIIGSQRPGRLSPQVADFILTTIKTLRPNLTTATTPGQALVQLEVIDLAAHGLPLYDEPRIPASIHSAAEYTHAHTQAWSARIAACDGFIFQLSQRNWGLPAELKNAIDYLFHEWKGKPALIVSMGGTGGEQSARHLREVLTGMGVKVAERGVGMKFPSREFVLEYAVGGEKDIGLDGAKDEGLWSEHRAEIVTAFDELVSLLPDAKAVSHLR